LVVSSFQISSLGRGTGGRGGVNAVARCGRGLHRGDDWWRWRWMQRRANGGAGVRDINEKK
jgi:hypothetical protein